MFYHKQGKQYSFERSNTMEKTYFTITGTRHYFGQEFFEQGMEVTLVKDPDNESDSEAIKVELEGLGQVGYVANSPYTVQGKSISAGRLYDRIADTAVGVVMYVLPQGVLCELKVCENEEIYGKDISIEEGSGENDER